MELTKLIIAFLVGFIITVMSITFELAFMKTGADLPGVILKGFMWGLISTAAWFVWTAFRRR